MGEFRAIAQVADVHICEALAQRVAAEFGKDWPGLRFKGDAWAYVDGGQARGIGGIEPVWKGRYVLWSYVSELSVGDWRRVLRFTRLRLQRALAQPDVNRVEATALLTHPRYCRFLERLGFLAEGMLLNYSPKGEDMMMYSRVPGGEPSA